ncbi:hypothetical protein HOD83_03420 [Candidatus Woesearchaeota archaeon]|jgi:hypothetical protein|nr:hypothetical protein [Candidatus Woesearchaeota archaeon]MBT4114060.1 hypothetical protein [Candidatus Woesearchaeota archaeon]MBT4248604.1 hypothetical protein [Candidatus Woesearchaeota archaeon]
MADPFGDIGGNIGKGLGSANLGSFGESKYKTYLKWTLIIASILGILSALAIFSIILGLGPGSSLPIGIETLGIIAGLCAFITGLDTLYNTFRKKSDTGGL